MGLFNRKSKVKESADRIAAYLQDFGCPIKGLQFNPMVEKDFCAFITEELNGRYECAFGGDFESSITIRYSEGRGIQGEVYVSSKRAREAGDAIVRTVREVAAPYAPSLQPSCSVTVSFTDFVPNESALSFELQSADFSTPEQFNYALARICTIIKDVATKLS